MKHARSKQRKPRAHQTAHNRIGSNSRIGVHEVAVDQVDQTLHEDEHDTRANGRDGDDLRPGGNVRGRGPGEPEEARGEQEGADHHGDEALLRDDAARGGGEADGVAGAGVVCGPGEGEHDADEEGEEG